MICRSCGLETGDNVLVDLGSQPLSNAFVSDPEGYEPRYPLAPVICQNRHCQLVQLPAVPDSPFTAAYPYRSSQSATWVKHLEELATLVNPKVGQHVIEVGGNDGALGPIVHRQGRSYLNIDPTADPKKIGTEPRFLTREVGEHFAERADWVVANNVMAHVPDLDDFLAGVRALMRPGALLTVEVPDLNTLIETGAWDTIYHEHYSYFNRQTAIDVLERRGFFVSHVDSIPTHGGSLRLFARKNTLLNHPLHRTPLRIMKPLPEWGDGGWEANHPELMNNLTGSPLRDPWIRDYSMFPQWRAWGKRVVGYGAPAKANTFLNYWKMSTRYIDYIVDSTPEKIGKYTPGSHIPIVSPDVLFADTAKHGDSGNIDIVVILAWNWLSEVLPKIPLGPEVWCRGERVR